MVYRRESNCLIITGEHQLETLSDFNGIGIGVSMCLQHLLLYEAAGNAGPTLSIGANATGIFTDNTHTYTAAATDAMNYQIVTGSTGTSISISFIEVCGNATPAATATRQTYRHFDNTPRRILGRQNYNGRVAPERLFCLSLSCLTHPTDHI
jgi:hypothetical protein